MKAIEWLMIGSAEINRKLAAINQITRSIIGTVDTQDITHNYYPIRLEAGENFDFHWVIHRVLKMRKGQKSQSRWVVEFYDPSDRLIFSTNPINQREPALEDVAVTYESLEILVQFCLQRPSVLQKTKPLYEAFRETLDR
jgi:hypothetical protein